MPHSLTKGARARPRSRLSLGVLPLRAALTVTLLVLAACARARPADGAGGAMRSTRVDSSHVHALVSALADDSMQGRRTGTPGSARAARWIAGEMSRIGLTPAGDSGYFQHVPLYEAQRTVGGQVRLAPALASSFAARDTFPVSQRLAGANLVGILRGSDPALAHEAVLVDAHYDHLGIGAVADGDSIFNGADDDASGTVAVLEIARVMAAGPRPRRTVIFLATTGEEVGLLGTRWYIQHPVVPLDSTVANLEIEMIGRPDSMAGGRGRGWLTGYERSTMGEALAAAGIPLVADRRLDQNFFMRSDNIAFARLGIPAHTLSSYNMHTDYHRRTDEVSRLDAGHMALVIDAAARAVRLLADGPKPEWKPGGRPEPATPRR